MQTAVDIFTLLVVIASPFLILYLAMHAVRTWWARRNAPDPYADFDRWQQAFHSGVEARQSGLDPEDNPFLLGSRDYTAWLDGYIIAGKHGAEPCEREVA